MNKIIRARQALFLDFADLGLDLDSGNLCWSLGLWLHSECE